MAIMHRILTLRTLGRTAAARQLLVGFAVPPQPSAAFCCCTLRPALVPPTGRNWVSTSASSRASLEPKPQSGSATQPQEVHEGGEGPAVAEVDPLQDKSIGLYQRFKKTFKQYGKVLIPLHLVTSSVWFGSFYYAAMK